MPLPVTCVGPKSAHRSQNRRPKFQRYVRRCLTIPSLSALADGLPPNTPRAPRADGDGDGYGYGYGYVAADLHYL